MTAPRGARGALLLRRRSGQRGCAVQAQALDGARAGLFIVVRQRRFAGRIGGGRWRQKEREADLASETWPVCRRKGGCAATFVIGATNGFACNR